MSGKYERTKRRLHCSQCECPTSHSVVEGDRMQCMACGTRRYQ